MWFRSLIFGLLVTPWTAAAHPHLFINAGLTLQIDADGRLEAVTATWEYDKMNSLRILLEFGADEDWDGQLTEAESARLSLFDQDEAAGYTGVVEVRIGDVKAVLSDPVSGRVDLADGRLRSSHTRWLETPVALDAPVEISTYDPTYYAALTLSLGAHLTGQGSARCQVRYLPADIAAATDRLEELRYGPESEKYSEDNFPRVGADFADSAVVLCAVGS